MPGSDTKHDYLEACKAYTSSNLKKRGSKRSPPKYTRHASRDQSRPRKPKKKAIVRQRETCSSTCSEGDDVGDKRRLDAKRNEDGQPLEVPRIDIVEPSPTIGSKSPNVNLERSPSMPAVLPDQVPEYMNASQPFKPALTRPLTTPSLQSGDTGSAASPGWGCNGTGTSGRIPLLPLPGTPAAERAGHDFSTGEEGAPLHTCATDTSQSMPVTFNFQDTNTSRSTSFPGVQQQQHQTRQQDGKFTSNTTEGSSCSRTSKQSSRSASLSSSVSRLTNNVRVLRITNPDPPSPVRSAAPSRTPSMTIAQKRFVSCPPAPLLVERANGYSKSTGAKNASVLDTPASKSSATPTSASNSASTPSFQFSDDERSPISPASAISSLPATPTKLPRGVARPLDLDGEYKKCYGTQNVLSKDPDQFVLAPPVTRTLKATAIIGAPPTPSTPVSTSKKVHKAVKTSKTNRRLKRCKSTSSGDGDKSEGVESCFESVGAPSEYGYVAVRKKRFMTPAVKVKRPRIKESKSKTSKEGKTTERSEGIKNTDNSTKTDVLQEQKQEEMMKPPKSPLLLDKPRVGAALDISNGRNLENLTTFWTPIGRVIISPVPCATSSAGLNKSATPSPSDLFCAAPSKQIEQIRSQDTKHKDKAIPLPRAFLIPPRSPRPPNTRRLGNDTRDALSRSEIRPPQYDRNNDKSLLSVPDQHQINQAQSISSGGGAAVGNIALSLSLPLPSPMRLDVFTNDLLAKCTGVGLPTPGAAAGVDEIMATGPIYGRRSNLEDGVPTSRNNEKSFREVSNFENKRLPCPGDPFISAPNDIHEHKQEPASVRPCLPRTHPATLRPSTPTHIASIPPSTTSRYFTYPFNPLHQSTNKRFVSLPDDIRLSPPPLPPRHREVNERNAVSCAETLREQLVANGALISGDEAPTSLKSHIRNHQHAGGRKYRSRSPVREQEEREERHREHRHRHHHHRHNHKTATLFEKEDVIIPIANTVEYDRGRAMQGLSHTQADQYHQQRHSRELANPTPSVYVEGRVKKSGFEILQRQHEGYGYTREPGQERNCGRERERDRVTDVERPRGENENGFKMEGVMMARRWDNEGGGEDHRGRGGARADREGQGQGDDDGGEGEGNGAIRLGEHKRGFDTCEIERWLQGLRKAATEVERNGGGRGGDEMDLC